MHVSKIRCLFLGQVLLGLAFALTGGAASAEDGFESIFNGTDLTGWDGNPKFWRVEDGAITGETTKENPTKGNTFIIWRQGDVANFALRLKYRIVGTVDPRRANSGIQYRSTEYDNWVVGGYQADFEAGTTYSGILYHERGRGILAQRGQMTVVKTNPDPQAKRRHVVEVIGSLGESDDIQSVIKPGGWNDYTVIAHGNQFTHIINRRVTVIVRDEDAPGRKDSGILALQLHAGPPMKVQFKDIQLKRLPRTEAAAAGNKRKKVVFVAGRPSHGYNAHEYYAGCVLLAKHLQKAMPDITCDVHRNGWPQDGLQALEGADAVVVFCDGGGRHLLNPHVEEFATLMDQGVGLACLHYGVEVPKGESGDAFLDWIGGYFETSWSVNPHWKANFTSFPSHPVCRGVEPFEIDDEWYFHMRFRDQMQGVTPILSAVAPASTMSRRDGAHSGNPAARKAVAGGAPQHVAWVAERPDGGRGFGFTGGHWHYNWGDDNFRKVVLNGIVWIAHGDVPPNGVSSDAPSQVDLEENQDYPKPKAKRR